MRTRQEMVEAAKKYFKEHPEKRTMRDVLFDLGITQIQRDVIRMGARDNMPYEVLKAYSDQRLAELKAVLNIDTET